MEFPILGPASIYVAQVALAAWKQVKHAAFRNALMAKEGNMDEGSIQEDLVLQVAKSVGLDYQAWTHNRTQGRRHGKRERTRQLA
jgi:hypothetical protein